jgi:hypothetical protein
MPLEAQKSYDSDGLFDVHRLLVGQAPGAFLAELFVRGVVIYVILVALPRLTGKRVAGQLSITDLPSS